MQEKRSDDLHKHPGIQWAWLGNPEKRNIPLDEYSVPSLQAFDTATDYAVNRSVYSGEKARQFQSNTLSFVNTQSRYRYASRIRPLYGAPVCHCQMLRMSVTTQGDIQRAKYFDPSHLLNISDCLYRTGNCRMDELWSQCLCMQGIGLW